jgi:hypothetical protein
MSEILNDDDGLEVPDELTALKARADMLGLSYHPSIGVEKLRTKINDALADKPAEPDEVEAAPEDTAPAAKAVEETAMQRRIRKRKEATELVRIRVQCMNPAKKEWEGEIFTAGNSLVGSFSKFVPFTDAEDGWHVPRIIYNLMADRQCQVFTTVRDARGNSSRKGKLIREFAIEVLPKLTMEELKDLAQRQAMAKSID